MYTWDNNRFDQRTLNTVSSDMMVDKNAENKFHKGSSENTDDDKSSRKDNNKSKKSNAEESKKLNANESEKADDSKLADILDELIPSVQKQIISR